MAELDKRINFIKWIVGAEQTGYITLAAKVRGPEEHWFEECFAFPSALPNAERFLKRHEATADMYFCPTVLNAPKREKTNISTSTVIWSDLDACPPSLMKLIPTAVVETSSNRYQAYWKLQEVIAATDVENANKRLAYYHQDSGADISGWDLTQLLRIPGTVNRKYMPEREEVRISEVNVKLDYDLSDFDIYPAATTKKEVNDRPYPTDLPKLSATDILNEYQIALNPKVWELFNTVPEEDWSRAIWRLETMLFEGGLTAEEVLIVANEAACNKFDRDQKNQALLWKDILRAEIHVSSRTLVLLPSTGDEEGKIPDQDLLTDAERQYANEYECIVDRYVNWAKSTTDAAQVYHNGGAFIILSTLLAGILKLPTSYGTVTPNLWVMLLGDTTLTRKTTAMDMAMSIVNEIEDDALLATDGTIEGLLTELQTRPNVPSVFLRDEFTGLLESMTKKDYYAGMMEAFAKLYDGGRQKRILRREKIDITDPILIMFAGGIKERALQLIEFAHINSGFMPRFIVLTADADLDNIKPIGPPTVKTSQGRNKLVEEFEYIKDAHSITPSIDDLLITKMHKTVSLTPEAWMKYNYFESVMLQIGTESSMADLLTPMLDRLCKSGLKAAVLLAASEQEDEVIVTEEILIKAFSYVEMWKQHTISVVVNAGRTVNEKLLERIYNAISKNGTGGVRRATIMNQFRLTARDAENLLSTLEQRGLTRSDKRAGYMLYAVDAKRKVAFS